MLIVETKGKISDNQKFHKVWYEMLFSAVSYDGSYISLTF